MLSPADGMLSPADGLDRATHAPYRRADPQPPLWPAETGGPQPARRRSHDALLAGRPEPEIAARPAEPRGAHRADAPAAGAPGRLPGLAQPALRALAGAAGGDPAARPAAADRRPLRGVGLRQPDAVRGPARPSARDAPRARAELLRDERPDLRPPGRARAGHLLLLAGCRLAPGRARGARVTRPAVLPRLDADAPRGPGDRVRAAAALGRPAGPAGPVRDRRAPRRLAARDAPALLDRTLPGARRARPVALDDPGPPRAVPGPGRPRPGACRRPRRGRRH